MLLPSLERKLLDGQGNDLGYGKNVVYDHLGEKWAIRSQVLSLSQDMDAVHRLDVGGRG